MKNKVLIKLLIPELYSSYDLFIPVNELIWRVKKIIAKCISDLSNIDLDIMNEYILINKDNSRIYKNNEVVLDTDIRNGSELIIITKK